MPRAVANGLGVDMGSFPQELTASRPIHLEENNGDFLSRQVTPLWETCGGKCMDQIDAGKRNETPAHRAAHVQRKLGEGPELPCLLPWRTRTFVSLKYSKWEITLQPSFGLCH